MSSAITPVCDFVQNKALRIAGHHWRYCLFFAQIWIRYKENMSTNNQIFPAIACNLDSDILSAALPLLESEKVAALEWSFDALFKHSQIPDWFCELLAIYSSHNRLVGHGVFFSLFSGKWLPEQTEWLTQLKKISTEFSFDHITEHFGFMTGKDFHKGAPIGIPYTPTTLSLGIDRLKRIQDACQCPVGLENLAFAYTLDEVKIHGHFLEKLINPVNGFIILDLHNIYCQLCNFDISFEELIGFYPLDKVREIHISGGSWAETSSKPQQKIRRDTHDEAVPNEVFGLLKQTLGKCKNLKYVVLEQIGAGLKSLESQELFRQDFEQLYQIVQDYNKHTHAPHKKANFYPSGNTVVIEGTPPEDADLYEQQKQLSDILENAPNYKEAVQRLHASDLRQSAWKVEQWPSEMIETAIAIAQKWKNGF